MKPRMDTSKRSCKQFRALSLNAAPVQVKWMGGRPLNPTRPTLKTKKRNYFAYGFGLCKYLEKRVEMNMGQSL